MSTGAVRVYVDGAPHDVPRGSTVLEALRCVDAALAAAVEHGDRAVTDSRGLPISLVEEVSSGTILRVIPVRHSREDA